MKVIKEYTSKTGKRRLIVEIDTGESLLPVREDSHYRLGQPVDEVVGSHIVQGMQEVSWCSASQEWVS